MENKVYQAYLGILRKELVPALGCTEPIALAYAAASAKSFYDGMPKSMHVFCSGNVIKNVKSVTIPNSGNLHGIEAAVILGLIGGDAKKGLEVLESVTREDQKKTKRLLEQGFCTCHLQADVENLYIRIELCGQHHSTKLIVAGQHDHIVLVEKDGRKIFSDQQEKSAGFCDPRELLNLKQILEFADTCKMSDIGNIIASQIKMNTAIAMEGLKHPYGAEVGRTLLKAYGKDIKVRARAKAAAGSDARMNGCCLPVVINSGSGNQGMTCSLPVIEYAREWGLSEEKLIRSLVVSNLVAIHQKKYIGNLSAFCGAVNAACGAGAGIAYMSGASYEEITHTIENTLGNAGGIVCDGAKSSCAAKIASAVDAAIMGYTLEKENHHFMPGEGLICDDVEETIQNFGIVGSQGMKETDETIMRLMIKDKQSK